LGAGVWKCGGNVHHIATPSVEMWWKFPPHFHPNVWTLPPIRVETSAGGGGHVHTLGWKFSHLGVAMSTVGGGSFHHPSVEVSTPTPHKLLKMLDFSMFYCKRGWIFSYVWVDMSTYRCGSFHINKWKLPHPSMEVSAPMGGNFRLGGWKFPHFRVAMWWKFPPHFHTWGGNVVDISTTLPPPIVIRRAVIPV